MGRKAWLLLGLAAAVGLPMWLTSPDGWKSALDSLFTTGDAAKKPPLTSLDSAWQSSAPMLPSSSAAASGSLPLLAGPPVQDLGEVFQFDVTPAWVLGRWPNVLTLAGPDSFQGYRVPLVTGTGESDLAGTLTYYFTSKPVVQRIRFQGVTGDPARLVALVTTRFGFVKQKSPEPNVHLYQIRWHGRPNSQLVVRMADTIRADLPLRRFSIDLEINLPDVPPSGVMLGVQ